MNVTESQAEDTMTRMTTKSTVNMATHPTATIGSEDTAPHTAAFTALPAELFLEIFTWLCWDEIDLTILSVSQAIRTILLSHPIVRALGIFALQKHENGVSVVINDLPSQNQPSNESVPLCPATTTAFSKVAHQRWFSTLNTPHLQAAISRRLIRKHWTPYLQRDGRLQKPGKMNELTQKITRLWWDAYELAAKGEMCILPDAVVEYPWTHLQMWPVEGRIVIRDQLGNRWEEINVGIVRLFEEWRGKGQCAGEVEEADGDGGVDFP